MAAAGVDRCAAMVSEKCPRVVTEEVIVFSFPTLKRNYPHTISHP